MAHWRARRPADDEYAPFYAGYVSKVSDGDILDILSDQRASTIVTLHAIPAVKVAYRYAPG